MSLAACAATEPRSRRVGGGASQLSIGKVYRRDRLLVVVLETSAGLSFVWWAGGRFCEAPADPSQLDGAQDAPVGILCGMWGCTTVELDLYLEAKVYSIHREVQKVRLARMPDPSFPMSMATGGQEPRGRVAYEHGEPH